MPAARTAAVAVITLVVAACAFPFSVFHAKTAHAIRLAGKAAQTPALNAEQRGRIRSSLDALPLAFEANQGQTDPQVKYTARGNGYSVFLTANNAVFAITSAKRDAGQPSRSISAHPPRHTSDKIESASIDMRLAGANPKPEITAGDSLPGLVNYYIGGDQKNWHTGIKQYSSVAYRDVYPGVNMVFHGAQRQLEFDFVVCPGADPKAIALDFQGARKLDTDSSGNLVLNSSAGDVVLHKPVAYQEKDGKREIVKAAFAIKNRNEVALNLGAYDRERELVIDPTLTYATYLGGLGEDDAFAIAIDGSGNAYVTGQTASSNFPTVPGAYSTSRKGGNDVFVSKIAADGSGLTYSTYIGSDGDDSGNAIAVDSSGNAFVAGGTTQPTSVSFPTTTGAFQTAFKGGSVDTFVLKLASSGGSLVFSTYLGGTGDDVANGIAIDTTGVYVVGSTRSNDFPTQSPFQAAFSGTSAAFVTKLNTTGTSPLIYSTYLGGGTNDFASAVAVASGKAYITGATTSQSFPVTPAIAFQPTCGTDATCNGALQDAFVTVLDSAGSTEVYSTFLGGENNDQGLGIAVDGSSGDAFVTGLTQSNQFPTKTPSPSTFGGGTQDAFVAELNPSATPAASTLVYSRFLGGSQDDAGNGIAVDSNKNAYVTGQTNSNNFPTLAATQQTIGGLSDGFVSEIGASGALVFSTYIGGALNDNTNASNPLNPVGAIAVDQAGANIYVAGNTASSPFPTVTPLQATFGGVIDAFVAKYSTGTSSANFTVTNGALSNSSGHAGVSATSTITVTSTNGFNSAVALQCTVSPVVTTGPTCSLDKASVTPPANGTATATLSVATTAASAALVRPTNRPGSGVMYALVFPVFGVTLLGAGIQKSSLRRRKIFGFSILGITMICLLILPACGGSNNNNGGGGGGTPTGAYTITVTGTNGSNVVTGTPALTLTVN
jgi:hypothetical protein